MTTSRLTAILALVGTLAALAVMPAVAASASPSSIGDSATGPLAPTPLPPVTGPMPQPREMRVGPGQDDMPVDLATLLARYATITRTAEGETTVTPPSAELSALLEDEFDALK